MDGASSSMYVCVFACVCGMQIDGAAKGLRSISLRSLRMWRCKVCYTLSFNGQLPLYARQGCQAASQPAR